jgi:predicted MFS family arabinose efflux permease
VIARFLLGIAAAGAVTCSVIVVNRLIPRGQRAKWMGRYVSLSYVMNICLQPLVGQLAERDWHYAFVIYAIGVPVCVIVLFWFPTGSRPAPPPADDGGPKESMLAWFPFRLGFIGLAIGWVTYITVIYMPFLLRSWGIGPAMASFVLMGDTITGIIASMLFGRARRHLSSEGAFVVAFGVAGIGTLITACAPNYATVMIGMAMLGLAGGWFLPNLMLTIGETVAAHRQGRTTGLVKAFNYLSMPVGLTLIEGPAQIYGPRLPIAISAILAFAVVAALAYRIHARKKQGASVVSIAGEGKAAA